jgi:hypothetical protein
MSVDMFREENKNIKKYKSGINVLTYIFVTLVTIYTTTMTFISVQGNRNEENNI